ncbi:hypothetical protein FOA52_013265 [Chlamydomonas sp. UWO 241]|nr:hypothetical protein FOA52_013265 [Chlamydomonas sp. UWO 241]
MIDLPLDVPGRQCVLRITLAPLYPQERPGLSVLGQFQHASVDRAGRVRTRCLDEWNAFLPGKANLVATVAEAVAILTNKPLPPQYSQQQQQQQPHSYPLISGAGGAPSASGSATAAAGAPQPSSTAAAAGARVPSPPPPPPFMSPPGGVGGGVGVGVASASAGQTERDASLESLPTSELERLLGDDDAFWRFAVTWVQALQVATTTEEIHRQNVALAQDNLLMQGSIDEARNHVAIVRSSEYASAKATFDELYARQEAVLKKLNPILLIQKLHDEADRLDAAFETSYDAFLAGSLPLEKFTAEHVQGRIEFHKMDLMRQAGQYTLNALAAEFERGGGGWSPMSQMR